MKTIYDFLIGRIRNLNKVEISLTQKIMIFCSDVKYAEFKTHYQL